MDTLQVKLPVFEGPLELLLHLIEKNKLDIYDIPIFEITKQYLAYLQNWDNMNMEVASEFIVMAATLISIKAKRLLPAAQKQEEEWIRKMLPVYDNLDRALKQPTSDAAYQKGVQLTMKELEKIFGEMGVEFFGQVGERFDPNVHNAVVHVYDGSRGENEISQVIERGVRHWGRILRFATVQVAN